MMIDVNGDVTPEPRACSLVRRASRDPGTGNSFDLTVLSDNAHGMKHTQKRRSREVLISPVRYYITYARAARTCMRAYHGAYVSCDPIIRGGSRW